MNCSMSLPMCVTINTLPLYFTVQSVNELFDKEVKKVLLVFQMNSNKTFQIVPEILMPLCLKDSDAEFLSRTFRAHAWDFNMHLYCYGEKIFLKRGLLFNEWH